MTWGAESGRTSPLPENWPQLRQHVLARDRGECQWQGPDPRRGTEPMCGYAATDVDHIDDPNDHDPFNLRALCSAHHAMRTSTQGNAARWRYRRQRPPERHPGLRHE